MHSKFAGEGLGKRPKSSVIWSLLAKFPTIMVLLALGSRVFIRFPGHNHNIGVLGCGYMRCGNAYTQEICSANDMVTGKSVVISRLWLCAV